jgi:hypothetical protein
LYIISELIISSSLWIINIFFKYKVIFSLNKN